MVPAFLEPRRNLVKPIAIFATLRPMETKVYEVTMSNFDDVMDNHSIVVLDFWAAWCEPCETLTPAFEGIAQQNPDIFFGKVNTESCQDLAQAFQIRSVPTIIAFKAGELVFEQSGLPSPEKLLKLPEMLRTLEVKAQEHDVPEEFRDDSGNDS